eukprot:CAMPEP_0171136814 /NCGR_PEP_ID=MMETSP0766_2-20121228/132212_1 /TAXON_ID=439317 /ORGANISM="Gambierdiscus australes, Strain CAWD 149" /LENGTH=89 /DNA_ID=CAMNT_0011600369 /DNA_START=78 /DNA_END=342 /DNA_ORIENTATION=-
MSSKAAAEDELHLACALRALLPKACDGPVDPTDTAAQVARDQLPIRVPELEGVYAEACLRSPSARPALPEHPAQQPAATPEEPRLPVHA